MIILLILLLLLLGGGGFYGGWDRWGGSGNAGITLGGIVLIVVILALLGYLPEVRR